jgi:hypothetical protein
MERGGWSGAHLLLRCRAHTAVAGKGVDGGVLRRATAVAGKGVDGGVLQRATATGILLLQLCLRHKTEGGKHGTVLALE